MSPKRLKKKKKKKKLETDFRRGKKIFPPQTCDLTPKYFFFISMEEKVLVEKFERQKNFSKIGFQPAQWEMQKDLMKLFTT